MLTFKQAIKLTFGRNKFSKRTMQNSQSRKNFQKNPRDQVDKIIDQLHLSKSIPNVSFKFISCQENCKWHVVMNSCNLRMRADVSNFKYRNVKMLLLRLASELSNLVKKFQSVLKVWTKWQLNFHELEHFHEVEGTSPPFPCCHVNRHCPWKKTLI